MHRLKSELGMHPQSENLLTKHEAARSGHYYAAKSGLIMSTGDVFELCLLLGSNFLDFYTRKTLTSSIRTFLLKNEKLTVIVFAN